MSTSPKPTGVPTSPIANSSPTADLSPKSTSSKGSKGSKSPGSGKTTIIIKSKPKTKADVLQLIATGDLSTVDGLKLIEEIDGKEKGKQITWKLSPKGAVSFYGLRRMPITLYIQELEKVLDVVCADTTYSEEFGEFVEENEAKFSRK